jgi:hypothetical protein
MMHHKIVFLALCAMLVSLCTSAEAQQPKVPRIGYLGGTFPLLERREAFRQGCASLGTSREKTLSLSGDLERANSNVSLR